MPAVLSVNVATPELFSFAVPMEVVPTRKFTVPVGVMPETLGVLVAVSVTVLPWVIGLGEMASAVVVVTCGFVTVTLTGCVVACKLLSPLYAPEIVYCPGDIPAVAKLNVAVLVIGSRFATGATDEDARTVAP